MNANPDLSRDLHRPDGSCAPCEQAVPHHIRVRDIEAGMQIQSIVPRDLSPGMRVAIGQIATTTPCAAHPQRVILTWAWGRTYRGDRDELLYATPDPRVHGEIHRDAEYLLLPPGTEQRPEHAST